MIKIEKRINLGDLQKFTSFFVMNICRVAATIKSLIVDWYVRVGQPFTQFNFYQMKLYSDASSLFKNLFKIIILCVRVCDINVDIVCCCICSM